LRIGDVRPESFAVYVAVLPRRILGPHRGWAMPRRRLQDTTRRPGGDSMNVPVLFSITIDDKVFEVEPNQTVLSAARKHNLDIPTMCHMEGISNVGACRLCLIEVEGVNRLLPACTTMVVNNMVVRTATEKLKKYRRITTELMFAERNHVCAVCTANGSCDLQKLGAKLGVEQVRFHYLFPTCSTDMSHPKFILDHNRCILCTRCVRTCMEVEGAYNWDVMGRGFASRVISDFNQPWKESTTCTSCGKCVEACPVGALLPKGVFQGQLVKHPEAISELVEKRRIKL
jgi:bidirectional [NiFe] hydrogenase diaphorase subunit